MARLLLILDELFPVRGAPQVRAENLLAALPDWERFGLGGQLCEGARREGFTLLPRPSERRPIAFLLFLAKLSWQALRTAQRLRPEVAVITVPKYEMLAIAPSIKRRCGTLIVDLRDSLDFLDYGAYLSHFLPKMLAAPLGKMLSALNRTIQERALKAADLITVANEGIKHSINHPRITVVPNGVDTSLFRPEGKEWFNGARPLRLVYLGNFAEKDRFEWLTALDGRADVELHLIGDGRNKEKIASLLARSKAVFHGVVPHERLPDLLRTMDLGFIFRDPGVDHSIPVCLFEYTAMNIPAVCNDTGLMAKFIREESTGFVVSSSEEFLGVVEELVGAPARLSTFHHLHTLAESKLSLRASRELFRTLLTEGHQ